MLPTWVNIVVVIVIIATNMVFITLRMVMIYWSALIFTAYILYNHSFEPLTIFKLKFYTKQPIAKVVENKFAFLLGVPFCTSTITIIVNLEHRRMVFEIFIGIHAQLPRFMFVIQSCKPTTKMVAFSILIYCSCFWSISSTRDKGFQHTL